MELWASSAHDEYVSFQGQYVAAGPTFSYGAPRPFAAAHALDPLIPATLLPNDRALWPLPASGRQCLGAPAHAQGRVVVPQPGPGCDTAATDSRAGSPSLQSHCTARAQDPVTLCAAQVRNESGPLRDLIWCKTTTASHCIEAPNRECLDNGDTCRVLFKDNDLSDRGIVEQMISSSLLPLVIVYSGDGFDFLDAMPEQTFLFCILCSSSNLRRAE